MAFLDAYQVKEIKDFMVSDLSRLGKLYRAKKKEYIEMSVNHTLVDDYLKEGWETFDEPLKTKTKIRMLKSHDKSFEDEIWCQFYELGFRNLNFDEGFILPFGKNPDEDKQIDVVAVSDETVFLIECKSSEKLKKAPSYKDEFEVLGKRLDGFRKAMRQIYGENIKVKYIFATKNLRLGEDSDDLKRLERTNSFYYNDNTYKYVNSLIKHYRDASMYQFLGLVFKNELINTNKIEIPAVRGMMGNHKYYMFSIEPALLLKMGFVLHRTRANESESPTYQRLLVPSRLKSIGRFIEDGGFFPNSAILNFSTKKNKLEFQGNSKKASTASCAGTLKIPNAYGIAYIIDGQHRIFGYAKSKFKDTNTIPVVAFEGLGTLTQLEIFMDINQNQKAVSPTLRLDLEEDLNWDSDRADLRLGALKSSIVKVLTNTETPLFRKISVGEDKAILTFKPFYKALTSSGLLPSARGNKYIEETVKGALYNTLNNNHQKEMEMARKKIAKFISLCYDFVETHYEDIFNQEEYFVVSNRGTFAFISLIGDLNKHEVFYGSLTISSTPEARFEAIQKYLVTLLDYIEEKMPEDEKDRLLAIQGSSSESAWLRFFQSKINEQFPSYNPPELVEWRERNNKELQDEGRNYGIAIEKSIKSIVLEKLKVLYGENWELEINPIKRACQERAEQEMEKRYKEGLEKEEIHWTEMFNINDYKKIIEGHWTKQPKEPSPDFKTFEKEFAIDIGEEFNSKSQKLKWISYFNSYRNRWAHEGTKEKGLNKKEVAFLEDIYAIFYPST
ncbi:DGQHR domain-containing protein [Pseudomonadota bacterium]